MPIFEILPEYILMFVRKFTLFIIVLCAFQAFSSAAVVDRYISESQKCARIFPYMEKRYKIPPDALHSISLKESGRIHPTHKISIVWPWAVNVEGEGFYFETKREAILFVKKQLLQGKESIDVGCMQINLKHHPDAFRSLEQAFDPGRNIAYGAQFLRSKYEQFGDWHKAIAHYHSATHELGSKYKQEVIKIASNMNEYKSSLKKHVYQRPIDKNRTFVDQQKPSTKLKNNRIYAYQKRDLNSRPNKYRSSMMVRIPK
jgi:soluble lytic murein transglycosylase-like protein